MGDSTHRDPSGDHRAPAYSGRLPGISDLNLFSPHPETVRPPPARQASTTDVGVNGTSRRTPGDGDHRSTPPQAYSTRPSYESARTTSSAYVKTEPDLRSHSVPNYSRSIPGYAYPSHQPHSNMHGTSSSHYQNAPTANPEMPPVLEYANHRRNGSNPTRPNERPPTFVHGSADGSHYLYDDGTAIPKWVAGQPVNPHHGITKQGNPRKRGSHACAPCRSKKVKCDLESGDPKGPCKSCARSNIECRWSDASNDCSSPERQSDHSLSELDRRKRRPFSGDVREHVHSDGLVPPLKRPRLHSHLSGEASLPDATYDHPPPMAIGFHSLMDPVYLSRSVTVQLLDLYFDYRDSQCTQVLPRQAFMDWVFRCVQKSSADLMLVHACMALGSVYTTDARLKSYGEEAMQAAKHMEASRTGQFDLQLALTRTHFALYYWATAQPTVSFEHAATACRVLGAIRFNTEEGCKHGVNEDSAQNVFRLSAAHLIECRRRAFWLAYCTERYCGHVSGASITLPDGDIFVRLPSDNESYTQGAPVPGGHFNEGDFDISTSGRGVMTAFISMVAIWGTVTENIFKTVNRGEPDKLYAQKYDQFYAETSHRLEQWVAALPVDLRYSTANTKTHLASAATFSTYYVLQSIYHATILKLNRNFRFQNVSENVVKRNIRAAHHAASQYLELIAPVAQKLPSSPANRDLDNALSQPFPAYCILMATDVLTRGGMMASLFNANASVINADKVIRQHARYITSAGRQQGLVEERMHDLAGWKKMLLQESPGSGPTQSNGGKLDWYFPKSIEPIFTSNRSLDVVYDVSDEVYAKALDTSTSK